MIRSSRSTRCWLQQTNWSCSLAFNWPLRAKSHLVCFLSLLKAAVDIFGGDATHFPQLVEPAHPVVLAPIKITQRNVFAVHYSSNIFLHLVNYMWIVTPVLVIYLNCRCLCWSVKLQISVLPLGAGGFQHQTILRCNIQHSPGYSSASLLLFMINQPTTRFVVCRK